MSNQNFLDLTKKILCPPGSGVFTINTAKEKRLELQEKLYGKTDKVEELWEKSLSEISDNKKAFILGICSDTGGGILRGANWGPLFLRTELKNLYPDLSYFDLGDVRVIPHLLHDKYLNEKTIQNCRKALYGNEGSNLPVSALSIAETFCQEFYKSNPEKSIFGIGGDHSCSYPLVKTYLKHKKEMGKKVALIHFDAHTDLLVERLGIDICFGSWTTHVLDFLPSKDLCFQIGIRSTGKTKEHWEKTFGIKQYWAKELIENGPVPIYESICQKLKDEKIDEVYVSFDIDALDSSFASATGTPEPDGISPHEAILIMEKIHEVAPITGADMMEIAPFVQNQIDSKAKENTLLVGASLSQFLIGCINKD